MEKRRKTTPRRSLLFVVVLGLLVSACGIDQKARATPDPAKKTATVAPSATATTNGVAPAQQNAERPSPRPQDQAREPSAVSTIGENIRSFFGTLSPGVVILGFSGTALGVHFLLKVLKK